MPATLISPDATTSPDGKPGVRHCLAERAGRRLDSADSGVLFVRWTQFHDERAREALASGAFPAARSEPRSEPRSADRTQSEIAKRVGVSQMQVSRLLLRSLRRVRELTGDADSYDLLDH